MCLSFLKGDMTVLTSSMTVLTTVCFPTRLAADRAVGFESTKLFTPETHRQESAQTNKKWVYL